MFTTTYRPCLQHRSYSKTFALFSRRYNSSEAPSKTPPHKNPFQSDRYLICLPVLQNSERLDSFAHFLRSHGQILGLTRRGLFPRMSFSILRVNVIRDVVEGSPKDVRGFPMKDVQDVLKSIEAPIKALLPRSGSFSVPFGTMRSILPGKLPDPSDEPFDPKKAKNLVLHPSAGEEYDTLVRIYEIIFKAYADAGIFRGKLFSPELIRRLISLTIINPKPSRLPGRDDPPPGFNLQKFYSLRGLPAFRAPDAPQLPPPERLYEPVEMVFGRMSFGCIGLVQIRTGPKELTPIIEF